MPRSLERAEDNLVTEAVLPKVELTDETQIQKDEVSPEIHRLEAEKEISIAEVDVFEDEASDEIPRVADVTPMIGSEPAAIKVVMPEAVAVADNTAENTIVATEESPQDVELSLGLPLYDRDALAEELEPEGGEEDLSETTYETSVIGDDLLDYDETETDSPYELTDELSLADSLELPAAIPDYSMRLAEYLPVMAEAEVSENIKESIEKIIDIVMMLEEKVQFPTEKREEAEEVIIELCKEVLLGLDLTFDQSSIERLVKALTADQISVELVDFKNFLLNAILDEGTHEQKIDYQGVVGFLHQLLNKKLRLLNPIGKLALQLAPKAA